MSPTERTHDSDVRLELACFELEGVRFAVDVAQVREISRCPELVPLPHAPALIEGVADRGTVPPIPDLGRALGRAPVSARALPPGRAAGGRPMFGLRVSAPIEVISVSVGTS
jgi:chemotaxis signal transduction protein